jgi:Fic family protein
MTTQDYSPDKLWDFVAESNQIESIQHLPTPDEIAAHQRVLELGEVTVAELELFVERVAGAKLRRRHGANVYLIGEPDLPRGGPEIERSLAGLLRCANEGIVGPYETHVAYELLHPFNDGNGRSGRVLWAWQMRAVDQDPFIRPFLQMFYYQTLSAMRAGGR